MWTRKNYHNSDNHCSDNIKTLLKMRILEFHETLNVSMGLCSHKKNVKFLKKLQHIFTSLIFFASFSYVILFTSAGYIIKNLQNFEEVNMAVFQFFMGFSTLFSSMFVAINRSKVRKVIDGFQNIAQKRRYQNDVC